MNNFDLRKFLNENKTSKEEVKEAAPGFQHDCAAHVVHETYGYGICLDEQHTLVENAEGEHVVSHYDVFFKEGNTTVMNVPVNELKVLTSESHNHKKKKNEEEVASEGESIEEDAATAIGTVGGSVVLALIAKVGFDIVLGFIAKKFPEKFAKFNEKFGGPMTNKYLGKDAIGDVGKAKFGEEVNEEDLQESKFKEEIKNILNS